MKTPKFAHGTLASAYKAIESGRITYPAYIWIDDTDQYSFLNKNGELEICGIPKIVGTLEKAIILSSLEDGLYEIQGQHKITADHPTTFDSSSYILVVIQTINGTKKIRRITADELDTYVINEDLSVDVVEVATSEYLKDKGYTTEDVVDGKIQALKESIEGEIAELVEPIVKPIVEEIIDRDIQSEDDEGIRQLFE